MPYQAGLEQQPEQHARSREEELQLLLRDVQNFQSDFEQNELRTYAADQVRILEDRIKGLQYNINETKKEYEKMRMPEGIVENAWWSIKTVLNPIALFTTSTYQVSSWLSGATEATQKTLAADEALLKKYKARLDSYRTEVTTAESGARELSTAARTALNEAERLPFGAGKQQAIERAISLLEQTRETMFVPIGDLSADWRRAMNGAVDANGNRSGGVNEMFAKADQHFESQLSALRTARNGCIVIVATLPVAAAAATGGAAVGIGSLGYLAVQGAAYGTAAGVAMSAIEQTGHVAHGNKNGNQAWGDLCTQTVEDAKLATKTSIMAAAGFGTTSVVLRGGGAVIGAVLPKAVAANPVAIGLATRAFAGATEGFVSTSIDLGWSSVETGNKFDATYDYAHAESYQQVGLAFREVRQEERLTVGQVAQRYATNMGISSLTSVLGNVIRPEQAKTLTGYWGRQALEGGVMGTVSVGAAAIDGEVTQDELLEVGFHTFMGQYVNGKLGTESWVRTNSGIDLPPVDTSTSSTRRESLDRIATAAAENRAAPRPRSPIQSQDAAVGEHLAALGLDPDGRYGRKQFEKARDRQVRAAERMRATDPVGAERRIVEACAACETMIEHLPPDPTVKTLWQRLRGARTDTFKDLGTGDTLAERVTARRAYQIHVQEGFRALGINPAETPTPRAVQRALDARVAEIRSARGNGSVAEAEMRQFAALVTDYTRNATTRAVGSHAQRIEARATAQADRAASARTLGLDPTKWPSSAEYGPAVVRLRETDAYKTNRNYRIDVETAAAYFASSSTDPLVASGTQAALSEFASRARIRQAQVDFEDALTALDLTRDKLVRRSKTILRAAEPVPLTRAELLKRASRVLSDDPSNGAAVRAAAEYVSDVLESGAVFLDGKHKHKAVFQAHATAQTVNERYAAYLSKDRAFEILGQRDPSEFLASRASSRDPKEKAGATIEARQEHRYTRTELDDWRTKRLAQIEREGYAISRAEVDAAHEFLLRQITPETNPTVTAQNPARRGVWQTWFGRWFGGHPMNTLRFLGTEAKATLVNGANLLPLDTVDFIRRLVPQAARDRVSIAMRRFPDQPYQQVRQGPTLDELIEKHRNLGAARETFGWSAPPPATSGFWNRVTSLFSLSHVRTFFDPEWALTARRNELLREHANDPAQTARIREAHGTLHSEARRNPTASWGGYLGHTGLAGFRALKIDLGFKLPGYYMVYAFLKEIWTGKEAPQQIEVLDGDKPTGIKLEGFRIPSEPSDTQRPSGARLPQQPGGPSEPPEGTRRNQNGPDLYDTLSVPPAKKQKKRSTIDDFNDFNNDPVYQGRKQAP